MQLLKHLYFTAVILELVFCIFKLRPDDAEKLQKIWYNDWAFTGMASFAHLPRTHCLIDPDVEYDIAVLGATFDTTTMYRLGARFGPRIIRSASLRQNADRGFNF